MFTQEFEKIAISSKMIGNAMADRMGKTLDTGSNFVNKINQSRPITWLRGKGIRKQLNAIPAALEREGIQTNSKNILAANRSAARQVGTMWPKGVKMKPADALRAGERRETELIMQHGKKTADIIRKARKDQATLRDKMRRLK